MLFNFVSCPNYTYEISAWLSFGIMTQCGAGLCSQFVVCLSKYVSPSDVIYAVWICANVNLGAAKAPTIPIRVQKLPSQPNSHCSLCPLKWQKLFTVWVGYKSDYFSKIVALTKSTWSLSQHLLSRCYNQLSLRKVYSFNQSCVILPRWAMSHR